MTRRHRWGLRRWALGLALGLFLATVPVPRVAFATVSVTRTTVLPATSPTTGVTGSADSSSTAVPSSGPSSGAADGAPGPAAPEHAHDGADVPRVRGRDDDVGDFRVIGFTYDRAPTGPVHVRVRQPDGTFGAWTELHVEAAEGPDPASAEAVRDRPATEPLWVGRATGYEVDLPAADAPHARAVTVRDETRRTLTTAEPVAGAAVPPPFGVNSRSSWGARPPAYAVGYGTSVRLAVVHHTASSNNYSPGDVPAILRSIQAFHMDGRGWSDIGYNFLVDKFGGVWEGRSGGVDKPVIGAHAVGFNTNSVGVSVIGDFNAGSPSGESLESVSKVVGWKLGTSLVDPSGTVAFTSGGSDKYPAGTVANLPRVVGHRDTSSTDCPAGLEGSLGAIRDRAQAWATFVRALSVPRGNLDAVESGAGSVTVRGWAVDPKTSSPATVRVRIGLVSQDTLADLPRPDVAAVYPVYGDSTGFTTTVTGLPPGLQDVCVWALDPAGSNTLLGCPSVRLADPSGTSPLGAFLSVQPYLGGVEVTGWAVDPDGGGPVTVDLGIDGARVASTVAAAWSPSVPEPWASSQGQLRAFGVRVPSVGPGAHRVCMTARNRGAGLDVVADCVDFAAPGGPPVGTLERVAVGRRQVVVGGWVVDPDSAGPVTLSVLIDDRRTSARANWPRGDLPAEFAGYGTDHGFNAGVAALPGDRRVCVQAVDTPSGSLVTLGCADVTIPK